MNVRRGVDLHISQQGTMVILVVDDSPTSRLMIGRYLEREGFAVTLASNGEEALASILQHRPALMLLDMQMPVMDGWELARELRERAIALPIVVMTGSDDAAACAKAVGAVDFTTKPVDLSLLRRRIESLFANSQP